MPGITSILGTLFGGRNPVDSIADILKGVGLLKDPEAELKAKQALRQFELSLLDNEAKVIESINATIREEAKSEHWPQYSWRPSIGFAFALQCLALSGGFSYLVFRIALGYEFDPEAINNLSRIMGAMSTLFLAEGGILGAAAGFRGLTQWQKEKNGNGNSKK